MGNGVLSTPATTSRIKDSEKSKERPPSNSFREGERRKKPLRRGSTGSSGPKEEIIQEDVPRVPGKSQIRKLGVEEVSQLIGGLGVAYTPYIKLFLDQQVDGEFLCRLVGTEIDSVMEIMGINDGRYRAVGIYVPPLHHPFFNSSNYILIMHFDGW